MSDNYNVYVNDDTEPNVSVSADSDVSALVDDDSNVVLDVEEDAGALLNADINDEELVDVPIEETIGELGADHRRLLHRDAADQHPMSAITGLTDSLTGLQNTIDSGLISVETSVSDVTLLANGKNTVYHSSTMPTGGEYKVGDTWFNSSESYCMYKWDGSNWIREQFGNGAFANASIWNATIQDGAITNAKIEDATIEGAKIKDATITNAKISSLNGDKITANSLTIGKMASDVTNAISAAGNTASNYITTISGRSGICVHDANDTSNYVNLNSSGMGVYTGGDLAASFSSSGANFYNSSYPTTPMTEIGLNSFIVRNPANNYYCKIDQGAINFYGLTSAEHAYIDHTGGRLTFSGTQLRMNGVVYSGGGLTTAYKLLTIGTVADSFNVTAGTYDSDTVSASKYGYKAVGIIGWEYTGTSSTYCNMFRCYIDDSDTIHYGFRNLHTSNDATLSITFYVLYIASTQGV